MDSSDELLEQASHGDSVAIDTLLQQHLPGLNAFVRLRMGPALSAKESTSDVVQSVCREILLHMDRYQYRSDGNFKQWLYATALRKVSNKYQYYRRARRDVGREVRPARSPGDDETRSLADYYHTLSTPSQQLMMQEQVERLESAFAKLPDHYREVITLAKVVGLSHREIAEQMGKSETATRSLLLRALSALAEALQ